LLLLAAIYLQKKADSGKPFHGLAFATVDFNNNRAVKGRLGRKLQKSQLSFKGRLIYVIEN
jgi:hypothetical protein